tara:strand:- start:2544 stop:3185 length:642 start_codon:yes stop_codon:yes gene_type:complete
MKWSYIKNDSDTALVNYAQQRNIEDKCTWQANTLEYILSVYNKKTFRRCIDAGANYGYLTVGFSRHFENTDAFEISTEIREHLLQNTKTFTNIKVHGGGLYSQNTDVNFKLLSASGMSRITVDKKDTLETVITLDSLNYKDVDLLKIDVEGSEDDVIKGAENTIKHSLPIVVVEIHCRRDNISFKKRQYIFNFLYSLGYKLVDVRHHDFLFTV